MKINKTQLNEILSSIEECNINIEYEYEGSDGRYYNSLVEFNCENFYMHIFDLRVETLVSRDPGSYLVPPTSIVVRKDISYESFAIYEKITGYEKEVELSPDQYVIVNNKLMATFKNI